MVASWPGGLHKQPAAQAGPGPHTAAPSRAMRSYKQAHVHPSALDCHHAQLCSALPACWPASAPPSTRPVFPGQHHRHSRTTLPRQHGWPEGPGSRAACCPTLLRPASALSPHTAAETALCLPFSTLVGHWTLPARRTTTPHTR